MDKRYQVFISSTFEDLKAERQAILKGVLELDHMPAGMELFPPTDDSAWRLICDVIDASDYYVLVIGGRYGSLDSTGISFTEKEYEYSITNRKPVIALLHQNPNNIERGKTETDPDSWEKLEKFRKKVESAHTCGYWKNSSELKSELIIGLTSSVKRHPAVGWVRSDSISSDKANQKILALQDQVAQLQSELSYASHNPPKGSERLAQGDDVFELRLRVTFLNKSLGYHDPDKNYAMDFTVSASWDELFGVLGTIALQPIRETRMKSEIARFLKEKHLDQIMDNCDDGYLVTSSSIWETDFQTIKYQFGALGLLLTRQEVRLQKDAEKEILLSETTPYGRQKLMEVRAIYRDQSPNKSSKSDAKKLVIPS